MLVTIGGYMILVFVSILGLDSFINGKDVLSRISGGILLGYSLILLVLLLMGGV